MGLSYTHSHARSKILSTKLSYFSVVFSWHAVKSGLDFNIYFTRYSHRIESLSYIWTLLVAFSSSGLFRCSLQELAMIFVQITKKKKYIKWWPYLFLFLTIPKIQFGHLIRVFWIILKHHTAAAATIITFEGYMDGGTIQYEADETYRNDKRVNNFLVKLRQEGRNFIYHQNLLVSMLAFDTKAITSLFNAIPNASIQCRSCWIKQARNQSTPAKFGTSHFCNCSLLQCSLLVSSRNTFSIVRHSLRGNV